MNRHIVFAIAILLVVIVRQLVVEAYMIRGGSMAPTLISKHLEMRCPNCRYVFTVGERSSDGRINGWECPNCHFGSSEVPLDPSLENTDPENWRSRGPARV